MRITHIRALAALAAMAVPGQMEAEVIVRTPRDPDPQPERRQAPTTSFSAAINRHTGKPHENLRARRRYLKRLALKETQNG